MFTRTVCIRYKGVMFSVTVCCNPDTPVGELKRRARTILLKAFDIYSIDIVDQSLEPEEGIKL